MALAVIAAPATVTARGVIVTIPAASKLIPVEPACIVVPEVVLVLPIVHAFAAAPVEMNTSCASASLPIEISAPVEFIAIAPVESRSIVPVAVSYTHLTLPTKRIV